MFNAKRFSYLFLALAILAFGMYAGFSAAPAPARASAASVGLKAPAAAPTPIGLYKADGRALYPVNFVTVRAVTTTYTGTVYTLARFEIINLQYTVDQSDTNTTTAKLQFSCDGVNWVDGENIYTNTTADTTGIVEARSYCIYARPVITTANNNPVTISLIGLAK